MKLTIYTDGGSRGNPGPAASGVVIKNESGEVVDKFGKYLGPNTNNVAEYTAVVLGLQSAQKLQATEVEIVSDSMLVVEQLKQNWKVKDIKMQKLFIQSWNLLQSFSNYSIRHVRREYNKEADAEVNLALDLASDVR